MVVMLRVSFDLREAGGEISSSAGWWLLRRGVLPPAGVTEVGVLEEEASPPSLDLSLLLLRRMLEREKKLLKSFAFGFSFG